MIAPRSNRLTSMQVLTSITGLSLVATHALIASNKKAHHIIGELRLIDSIASSYLVGNPLLMWSAATSTLVSRVCLYF